MEKKGYVLMLFLLLQFWAMGQNIQTKCVTDKSQILIGEQFELTISVEHTAKQQIKPFALPDTLGGFEVIRKTPAITGESKGLKTFQQNFTLTHFDSGVYQLPALPIFYQEGEDTTRQVAYTQPITIRVNTVPVDTSKAFKPIFPIQTAEYEWQEALPYLIVLAILLAIALIVYVWWLRKKRKKKVVPPPAPRPLLEIVQEKLAAIEQGKSWETVHAKHYYTELTEVLRFYLAKRYHIHTLEATTDELLAQLKDKIEKEKYYTLEGILRTADLAKFAKLSPSESENLQNLQLANEWVNTTQDGRLLNHLGEIVQSVQPQK